MNKVYTQKYSNIINGLSLRTFENLLKDICKSLNQESNNLCVDELQPEDYHVFIALGAKLQTKVTPDNPSYKTECAKFKYLGYVSHDGHDYHSILLGDIIATVIRTHTEKNGSLDIECRTRDWKTFILHLNKHLVSATSQMLPIESQYQDIPSLKAAAWNAHNRGEMSHDWNPFDLPDQIAEPKPEPPTAPPVKPDDPNDCILSELSQDEKQTLIRRIVESPNYSETEKAIAKLWINGLTASAIKNRLKTQVASEQVVKNAMGAIYKQFPQARRVRQGNKG